MTGMRFAPAAALLLLVTACSGQASQNQTGSSSSASTPPATTTTATAALADLADTWGDKFDAVNAAFPGPTCAPEKVQSKGCGDYLTELVVTTVELEATIRGRSDATSYVDTLVETAKIGQASERYSKARCNLGGGTLESCQAEMIAITGGSVLVTTKLKLDELRKK